MNLLLIASVLGVAVQSVLEALILEDDFDPRTLGVVGDGHPGVWEQLGSLAGVVEVPKRQGIARDGHLQELIEREQSAHTTSWCVCVVMMSQVTPGRSTLIWWECRPTFPRLAGHKARHHPDLTPVTLQTIPAIEGSSHTFPVERTTILPT